MPGNSNLKRAFLSHHLEMYCRASLVAQRLRVRLPMQGTWVRAPAQEDSHMQWSGWAREPWLLSLRIRSLCSATGEATTVRGPRTAKKEERLSNFLKFIQLVSV